MTSAPGRFREIGRLNLLLPALNGFLALAAGAFGAHAAHDAEARELLRTGAQYQLVHAVAAIAVLATDAEAPRLARRAAALFGWGALVFAGSLDVLALTHVRAWGAVTPIGGLVLLAGWLVAGTAAWASARATPRPPSD